MSKDKAIIIFNNHREGTVIDIEVPLEITAMELFIGLNTAYGLGFDTTDIKSCYLKSENPIALLRGSKTLAQYEIRNGSIISYTAE